MIRDYAKLSCNNTSRVAEYKTDKKLGAVFKGCAVDERDKVYKIWVYPCIML